MLSPRWQEVARPVAPPLRPAKDVCLAAKAEHLAWRARLDAERERATVAVIARIEAMRREVFAAGDGVVPRGMTDLEREWRRLARLDPDRGLMDVWAKIAPAAWIDRKRWRDTRADARLDLLVALAADPVGVEAAEAAALSLRPRVRWELSTEPCAAAVLSDALPGDPLPALGAIRARGYVVVAIDATTITLGAPSLA